MMLESWVLCMAVVLYHEGEKNEPVIGSMAIAQSVLTRAKRDPAKVCDVVRANKQYSSLIKPGPIVNDVAWRQAQQIAWLSFHTSDFTGGADHFHAIVCPPDRLQECKPYWRLDMDVAGQWGNHIFYKPKGKRK